MNKGHPNIKDAPPGREQDKQAHSAKAAGTAPPLPDAAQNPPTADNGVATGNDRENDGDGDDDGS